MTTNNPTTNTEKKYMVVFSTNDYQALRKGWRKHCRQTKDGDYVQDDGRGYGMTREEAHNHITEKLLERDYNGFKDDDWVGQGKAERREEILADLRESYDGEDVTEEEMALEADAAMAKEFAWYKGPGVYSESNERVFLAEDNSAEDDVRCWRIVEFEPSPEGSTEEEDDEE